jgi:hypothetical protein
MYALITRVLSATVFICEGLAGQPSGQYIGYSAAVLRDAGGAGAAPQGEKQLITAFNGNTGQISIGAGYTAAIAVGDVLLLLHPSVASAYNLSGASISGTHAHADDLLWQTVFTMTPTGRRKVHSIWLDFVNFAAALQTVTYRLSYQVDGTNYRIFDSNAAAPWTIATDDGVLIALESSIDHPLRLELQKSVAEGAARNVPYEIIYEDMS